MVSLPSRTDRRDGMTLQASLGGLRFEFIDGPTGSELNAKAIPKEEGSGHLEGAELGCWRAHMNSIQEFVLHPLNNSC